MYPMNQRKKKTKNEIKNNRLDLDMHLMRGVIICMAGVSVQVRRNARDSMTDT